MNPKPGICTTPHRYLAAIVLVFFVGQSAIADDGKHLFILSGQSNMAGLRPDESFTPAVEKEFGKPNVIVVHDAHGGQPIRRWVHGWKPGSGKPPQETGDLYDRLLSKVRAATKGKKILSVTFLWMQGERDAREKQGDVYGAALKSLIGQVQKDLGRKDVNFVIGRLSDFDMQNRKYPHRTRIREVQVEYAESQPWAAWVDTDDLNDGVNRRGKPIKNDLHYSADGYKVFGTRLADKAISLIRKREKAGKNNASGKTSGVSLKRNGIGLAVSVKQDEQRFDLEKAEPDRRILYKQVGDVKLRLHVFEPEHHQAGDRRPMIVFFFGGGWNGGTPKQFYRHSRYLAKRGMLAFCAEYRVRSRNGTSPRACVMDGKSAIRFVRSHAKELGGDPDRIAAGGGSAGGHVAAATATVSGMDEKTDDLKVSAVPNALVLFNPVYDNSENGYGYDRVKDYWKQISPLHNLSRNTPPTIVFLGTEDKLIPVATAKGFQRRLNDLKVLNELHLYEGRPHGFFNRGKDFVDTVEKMDRFLTTLGYVKGKPKIREWTSGK